MILPIIGVLTIDALSLDDAFIAPGFQNAPLYLFAPLGTALLLLYLAGRRATTSALAAVLAIAVLASSLAFDIPAFRQGKDVPFTVSRPDAQQVQKIRSLTPGHAEVVSTFGVVGRFAGRRWVYPLEASGQVIPLHAAEVEFVIAPQAGNQPVPAGALTALEQMLTTDGAARIYSGPTARAYLYRPPRNAATLTVP
jgi:hypothetical protein